MRRVLLCLVLSSAVAGCATPASDAAKPSADAPAAKPSDKPAAPPPSAAAAAAKTEADLRLSQEFVTLDNQVDRFVMQSSQGGPDARAERDLLGPALAAQVAQYKAPLLAAAADASNPGRRRIAVKALGFAYEMKGGKAEYDPAVLPPLVAALSVKDDPRLVTNATYALARVKSPATPTEPLMALARSPDIDVRSNALLALGHVFDAKREAGASPLDPVAMQTAMPIFEAALFDPADPLIRAHAAAALGALGDPRAVDPLINTLRDEHPLVRTQTAIALSKLNDAKAIPALVGIIESTPIGTARTTVVLALTVLAESKGYKVPSTIGDDQRAWERFLKYGEPATQK